MTRIALILAGFFALPALLLAAEPKSLEKPKPVTLTFYVAGVECPSCVYSVNYSISQLKSVSDVTAGQWIENYANVTFDPKVVSVHQIAQAVYDAPPLHGTPYTASMKLFIPDYAKGDNARKVDALFAKWKSAIEVEVADKAEGKLILHFQPLKVEEKKTGPQGWTLEELRRGLESLGLKHQLAEEKEPM